jgi:hypothetical protein
MVAAHEPREQEIARVAPAQRRVLTAPAQDLLRLLERPLADERLVQARVDLAVPADESLPSA